jgi:hypothetical protein
VRVTTRSMATATTTVALGAVAGLAAAVVMGLPMSRQAEGFTPAYVAASVVRGGDPGSIRFRDATLVHHAAGVLAGVLFGSLYLVFAALLPALAVVGGVRLLAHVAALGVVVAFVYAFFADLVLPRYGDEIGEDRATAVTGQWLRSSVVFGATVFLLFPLLLSFV